MKQLVLLLFFILSRSIAIAQTIESEKDKDSVYTFVEEEAEFPGGLQALFKYINNNLDLTDALTSNDINGKIIVQFVVRKDGSITDIEITRHIEECPQCDEAVIRLFSEMPNWTPGKYQGKKVSEIFQLPINIQTKGNKKRKK